jgi:hypothetical protein
MLEVGEEIMNMMPVGRLKLLKGISFDHHQKHGEQQVLWVQEMLKI